jgi:hypothetical protein
MGLLVVLFWCAAAMRAVLRFSFRFGEFNSRLGSVKFPLRRQREFPGKGLICRVVFGPERHLFGTIAKIPGSTGITEKPRTPAPGGTDAGVTWGARSALPVLPPSRRDE